MFEIFAKNGRLIGACGQDDTSFWLRSGYIVRGAEETYWLDENNELQVSNTRLAVNV